MTIKIDYQKCCFKDGRCLTCGCGTCNGCVEACATGALTRAKIVEYDPAKCTGCGVCIAACRYGAIELI